MKIIKPLIVYAILGYAIFLPSSGIGYNCEMELECITWPVDSINFPKDISSDFGPRNYSSSYIHEGIDLSFNGIDKAEVKSLTPGTVTRAEEFSTYGNTVDIEYNERIYRYAHLYDEGQYKIQVEVGDPVHEGEVIGYVDSTGSSSGPHLHLTTIQTTNGEEHKINPLSLDIFDYTANHPEITNVEVKGKNVYKKSDLKFYLYVETDELEISARVEDTEKDLNEVHFYSLTDPILDETFSYPTSDFTQWKEEFKLNSGTISKVGFPIKMVPGDPTGKDKSTDTFVLDWKLLTNNEASPFALNIEAKDAKAKQNQAVINFEWLAEPIIKEAKIFDTSGKEFKGFVSTKDPNLYCILEPKGQGALLMVDPEYFFVEETIESEIQTIKPELEFSQDGKEVKFEHPITGLEDGPHTATIQVKDIEGEEIDSKKLLFFLDTKPPVLELYEPTTSPIPQEQTTFLVKYSDENGSGFPSTIQAMMDEDKVEARINGEEAILNIYEKDGQALLSVSSGQGCWEPGAAIDLYV